MSDVMQEFGSVDTRAYDVVICGGGLAGLTLALQLRQEHPDLSVLLAEKTSRPLPQACHKVGESSVELGSQYLERLGLEDYLLSNHIIKHGLRFYPGGGALPLERRCEIGPAQEPIVRSYQLDRGVLETDLRERVTSQGVTLLEGTTVKDIALGTAGAKHTATLKRDGQTATVTATWLVDATGRNALLRRERKLTRGTRHDAHAGWFRIDGKFDVNDMVPDTARDWHDAEFAGDRWRSTNHFMGEGYWAWVIPLSSGKTSIGLVVHGDTFEFDDVRTEDRVRAFLQKHEPVLAENLAGRPSIDFLCLKGYSHNVGRGWSPDRWAMVGEAGAFVDPLYSPGTDFIAFANSFTTELIRVDRHGGDLDLRTRELSIQYRALVLGNVDVYRESSPVYGHARAMLAKIYWDNFAYWAFPSQYFLRGIYRLSGPEHARFTDVGQRFVELSDYVQRLMREWALAAPEPPEPGFRGMPSFPSVLIDAHLDLEKDMTPDETLVLMKQRAEEGDEIVGELLVRILSEFDEEAGRALFERVQGPRWKVTIPSSRLDAVEAIGLARRHALRPLARDVERSLGRPKLATTPDALRRILGGLVSDK